MSGKKFSSAKKYLSNTVKCQQNRYIELRKKPREMLNVIKRQT